MSVCIEHINFKKNHFSQTTSVHDESLRFIPNKLIKIGFIEQLNFWLSRSNQRKDLAKLDKIMLDDIGYSEEQARVEFSKPFWK